MDWRVSRLIASTIFLSLCLGRSMLALETANSEASIATVPLGLYFGGALKSSPTPQVTSTNQASGRSATTTFAAAAASANLTAAVLSQAAAAASSQALAEASKSSDGGSQVGLLAQVIIAIGVLPVELIIVAIVLGIHRLMHRRPSRPLQTRVQSVKPAPNSLPYLQPKAELEDEQNRRQELHGDHLVNELDGEDAIVEIADDADSLILPLQGRGGVHEMSEEHDLSWEMPHQERIEVMGDECAHELGCPTHGRKEPFDAGNVQELESPNRANNEPMATKSAQELESPTRMKDGSIPAEDAQAISALRDDPVRASDNVNPSRSHFMLRQQEMAEIDDSLVINRHDSSRL